MTLLIWVREQHLRACESRGKEIFETQLLGAVVGRVETLPLRKVHCAKYRT